MAGPTDAQNNDALEHFIRLPVSRDMIEYLASKASSVIRCERTTVEAEVKPDSRLPPTPPGTPPRHDAPRFVEEDSSLPTLEAFITSLVERSHVQVSTLMTSLVYLARLQERLPPVAKGMRCTVHRIFLASLILAAKNLNDSSPKNKHWARYSCVRGFENFGFSVTEVNLMEKQLLFLLDWNLNIRQQDLYTHFEPFLAPIRKQQQVQDQEEAARKLRVRETRSAVHRPAPSVQDRSRSANSSRDTSPSPYAQYLEHRARLAAASVTPARPKRIHSRGSSTHSQPGSNSPPSANDIPGLVRGNTYGSISSTSSASSSGSTPASSVSPYVDLADESYVNVYGNSPLSARSCSQPMRSHHLILDSYDDEKPIVKKVKTSGNLFSRFLGADRSGVLYGRGRSQQA